MRATVLAVCLLWSLVPLLGQATQYRLERIVVEGSRIDDDIVRAEARLPEERMYTEEDFRQAVHRVRRLPFVADAIYRIEPGMTAGGTTLVIRILDVAPAFYDLDLRGSRLPGGETVRDGSALIGGRFFLHNLGILETAVQGTDEDDGFRLGLAYRAYDILGTGAFATVALAQRLRADVRDYAPEMVVGLGYPLTQRQTVTLSVARTESSLDREFDVLGDDDGNDETENDEDDNINLTDTDRFDFANLRWWYESIDDPIFATRGLSVAFGPHWGNSTRTVQTYNAARRRIDSTEREVVAYGLSLDASAYRRLFGRTVGFVRVGGEGAREDESEVETINGGARLGIAQDFHTHAEGALRRFKARLELGAGFRRLDITSPDGREFNDEDTFAEAAFVLRHRWGNVRLTGIYLLER